MKFVGFVTLIIFLVAIQSAVIAAPTIPKFSQAVIQKDSLVQFEKNTYLPVMSETRQNNSGTSLYKLVDFYYNKSNILFRIILFLNLFFLSSAVILILLIFIKRNKSDYVIYKGKKCQDRYSTFITQWIYENHQNSVPVSLIKELKGSIRRNVFTSELLSLHDNLSGESAVQLEELFVKAGLEKYAIKKINSPFWHVKAKGFRELAQMKISSENHLISKYLNSKNLMLRLEAMLAWIQLNPEDPLSYFDDPKIQFTEWGQINSLNALKRIGSDSDFGRLMQSSNKSAVVFALKMAGIFKQFDTAELVIEKLYDSDEEIRREAIIAFGMMELPGSNISLKEIYYGEEAANKTEILNSMILSEDQQNAPFFEGILCYGTDVKIRILAAKGLVKLGKKSEKVLESILRQADTSLKLIIMHAKDNRI